MSYSKLDVLARRPKLIRMKLVRIVVAALLVTSTVHAEDSQQCILKRGAVVDIRIGLAEAVKQREAWVAEHCKLVFNARGRSTAVGRHWECDGKFAGNEGTVIQSKEELRLLGFLHNALARVDLCCGPGRPPNWCHYTD